MSVTVANNSIEGTPQNDALFGTAGNDEINGYAGDDLLQGRGGNDLLDGGDGDDLVRGNAGNDILFGGLGSDNLRGGSGVDSFDGGAHGAGYTNTAGWGDRVSFFETDATQGVVADLRTGIISNDGFGNLETMVGIESLGSDTAFADTFHGHDGRNLLLGNLGDYLHGHGGDDDFLVTSAAALVDGGDGIDKMTLGSFGGWLRPDANGDGHAESAEAASVGWTVSLATGFVQDGYGNIGAVAGIENIDGSEFADVLVGNVAANVLNGGDGNDTLLGRGGDDTLAGDAGHDYLQGDLGNDRLAGGDGDDYLYGNAGDDLLDGGAGFDRVGYAAGATAGVTIDLRIQGLAQDTGSQGFDTLVGIEHVSGTIFDDVIIGDDGDNWLWGGSNGSGVTGNDNISGGTGNDLVSVGAGSHLLDGGNGIDTLSLYGNSTDIGPAGVTFSLARQGAAQDSGQGMMTATGFENVSGSIHDDRISGDDGANMLFGGAGNDALSGGDGDDTLYGDGMIDVDTHGTTLSGPIVLVADVGATDGAGANDRLKGGRGDDTLHGGGGDDVMTGSQGRDTFVIGAASGDDQLTDFESGSDKIRFDASSGVTSFAQLQFARVHSGLVISWGTADSILLDKTKSLSASDFEFDVSSMAFSSLSMDGPFAEPWNDRVSLSADYLLA